MFDAVMRFMLAPFAAMTLAACATGADVAEAPPAAPALFVARDADSTIYLYGTVHLRRSGEAWGGPHVEAALAESEEVWTEVSLTPEAEAEGQRLAMQVGIAPAGQPLSSWLDDAERARLEAVTERFGIPAGALERMRPWMAALTLSLMPMMQAGYDPQAAVDRAVFAWAEANGRTHRSFETVAQQIGFFSNLDDDIQRVMLIQAIDAADEAPQIAEQITAAWERGDLTALETSVIAETRDQYPEIYRALFVDRNDAWMEVLMRELDGAGVDFVAVGAGHIVGDEGLVAQLRERGVTVERVRAGGN